MSLNKKLFICFVFIFSFVKSQNNKAIDSTLGGRLDEVVVTATRTQRQLSSLPLPAQIIKKEQIQASNSVRLSDLINEQTGLITVAGHPSGEGLQIQGLDSAYTLVMIDGVPLIGRLSGTFDLDRITVANIKQIEVIKGASSCLYGSEAMGGVLNIITETPKDYFSGNFNQRLGTFDSYDISLTLSHKGANGLTLSGFVNRYSSEGYDLSDFSETKTVEPFSNYTFNIKSDYSFNAKTNLFYSTRLFIQHQDNSSLNTTGDLIFGEGELFEWNNHLKLSHDFTDKFNLTGEFYHTNYTTYQFLNDTDGTKFSESDFDQTMVRPEIRASFDLKRNNSIVLGGGLTHETLDRT